MPSCQRFVLAVILVGGAGGVLSAQTVAPSAIPAATAPVPGADYVTGLGQTLDPARLEQLSGGTDTHNGITLNGNVSDTSTDHTISGGNAIGSGAFSQAVGLPVVIQNSGNSVLIQNATIVNVQMQP